MLPTMDQFKEHVEKTVAEQVEWMKEEFRFQNLPLSTKISDVPTGPQGQARRLLKNKSFAGFRIMIQSFHYLREEVQAFVEYASYNAWPEIGGFETNDWRLSVDATISHELAHIVQFALKDAGTRHPLYIERLGLHNTLYFDGLGQHESGHGAFFRQIYKRFRQRFINQRVPTSAYTNPKKDFIEGDHFEQRMEAKTGEHPLVGIKFMFKGNELEVAGRNPRNAKLFGYMVKMPDGSFSRCKLSLIVSYSPEAFQIVKDTPALAKELLDLDVAQRNKKIANAKSSMTKRCQASFKRYFKENRYSATSR